MNLTADIGSDAFILNIFISLAILFFGIFLGKLTSYSLSKLIEKLDSSKKIKSTLVGLIINLVRWSIYLIFVNIALAQLPTHSLTSAFSNILLTIPLFVASITILVLGFIVAEYLKNTTLEFGVDKYKFLSLYVFYFIVFISGIYALRIALFSLESITTNYIVLIAAFFSLAAIAYHLIKK